MDRHFIRPLAKEKRIWKRYRPSEAEEASVSTSQNPFRTRSSSRSSRTRPTPPSWKNTQIARYVLVEDRTTIDKMAEEMVLDFKLNEKTLKNCPAVMVLTYVTGRSGYERDGSFSTPKEADFEMFDAGIAAQTFCLAAWERGVGTVITGYFDEEKITRLLNLPENQKVGCVIGLGYPDEEPAAPKRKSVEDLLTYK